MLKFYQHHKEAFINIKNEHEAVRILHFFLQIRVNHLKIVCKNIKTVGNEYFTSSSKLSNFSIQEVSTNDHCYHWRKLEAS
jgi:hypothetical protein